MASGHQMRTARVPQPARKRPAKPSGKKPLSSLAFRSALVVLALLAIAAAGWQLAQDWKVSVARDRLADAPVTIAPFSAQRGAAELADTSLPAEADLADGLLIARYAAQHPSDPHNLDFLNRAVAGLERAVRQYRYGGEAWTMLAYVRATRDGPTPGTLAALERSYIAARYLRKSGLWRVEFGLTNWDSLPTMTRGATIEEAIWLARLEEETRQQIFEIARLAPPEAYQALIRAWLKARQGDADFHLGQPDASEDTLPSLPAPMQGSQSQAR